MSTSKLVSTPSVGIVTLYLGGDVKQFRLACSAHIDILQFSNSPVRDEFQRAVRTTVWKGKKGKVYADHAYRNGRQVLVAVAGSFQLVADDGRGTEISTVVKKGEAVYLSEKIWHKVVPLTNNSLIFGHYSIDYDRKGDYIENREEFCSLAIR